MKYSTLFLVLIALAAFTSCSKEAPSAKNVPQVVMDAFAMQYPNVKNEKWGMEGDDFSAEFMVNRMEMDAVYEASGKLVATEIEIDPATLPDVTTAYVSENYPGSSILEAERRNQGESVKYEVKVKTNAKSMDLYFDGAGNFLGMDMDDEEDDEDNEDDDPED